MDRRRVSSTDLAVEADSNAYMVTWSDVWTGSGAGFHVYGQIFEPDHKPRTGIFQVDTEPLSSCSNGVLGQLSDRGYAATWQYGIHGGGSQTIRGRVLDSAGAGPHDFQIHSDPAFEAGDQTRPDVAEVMEPDGTRYQVYAWESHAIAADGNGRGIFARIFREEVPVTGEFRISKTYRADQQHVRIAPIAGTRWVAVFETDTMADNPRVFLRVFDATSGLTDDMELLGGHGFINDSPDVASDRAGQTIVATWRTFTLSNGAQSQVVYRLFDLTGAPLSGVLRVSDGHYAQYLPRIRSPFVPPAGPVRFAITWAHTLGASGLTELRWRSFSGSSPALAEQLANPNHPTAFHSGLSWFDCGTDYHIGISTLHATVTTNVVSRLAVATP